jgi:hypothetical protein
MPVALRQPWSGFWAELSRAIKRVEEGAGEGPFASATPRTDGRSGKLTRLTFSGRRCQGPTTTR